MAESEHKTLIFRINEIFSHPNADSLSIVKIGGYQCVIRTADYKVGDLAIYIQPDSVVPVIPQFDFLWKGKEMVDGTVPDRYRRITVRKFRKEWSEGLVLPLKDFAGKILDVDDNQNLEGQDVSESLGITHWQPPEPDYMDADCERAPGKRKKYPHSIKGWFYLILRWFGIDLNGKIGGSSEQIHFNVPDYDVAAYKNYPDTFEPNEPVVITEKIHGSNARFVYKDGHMYTGSHHAWKKDGSSCVWRQALKELPWIEEWCKAHEGYTLFCEVTPTQKFSDGTSVNYGLDTIQVFVYDVLNPDGKWCNLEECVDLLGSESLLYWTDKQGNIKQNTFLSKDGDILIQVLIPKHFVPVLYMGIIPEKLTNYVEGLSRVDKAEHIREGIVIRSQINRKAYSLPMGRPQVKVISNAYYEKTGV